MTHRLPPLNALKAFDAAARHLSVKMAAEELCVTPGAVSQMLKSLESHLGVKLFERVTRGIYLTDSGRDYLPPIRNALRQIAEASRRIAAPASATGVLTVSVTPFFAAAWQQAGAIDGGADRQCVVADLADHGWSHLKCARQGRIVLELQFFNDCIKDSVRI
eukprot:gene32179-36325_t